MLEDLKFALLNQYDSWFFRFEEGPDKISIIYDNIVLIGTESEILIYYDPEETILSEASKYLNKSNTIKCFHAIYPAIDYLKYLAKIKKDIKYELYHYFLFNLKKFNIDYACLQFHIVNNNTAIRCDISRIKLGIKPVLFNFIFISKNNGLCELVFYPEQPLWDEGKLCPASTVGGIIDYITNLTVDNYPSIPLKEQ